VASGHLRYENCLIPTVRPRVMHGKLYFELDGTNGARFQISGSEALEIINGND